MAQFLRVPRRLSRAVRHARRVVCVGGPGDGTGAHELLSKYFGEGLSVVSRLDDAGANDADALVFFGCDASGCGLADIEALERLSAGRHVVCDLGLFASLFDDDVLTHRSGRFAAEAVVKNPACFLEAFGAGDVLPWRGVGHLVRGEAFGWKGPQHNLRVALASYDGRILAVEKQVDGGRIAAIDLGSLDDETGDGFRDLSGLLVLEAIGAEMVDLGHYRAPWLSYEEHIGEIEAWASMHEGMVSVEQRQTEDRRGAGASADHGRRRRRQAGRAAVLLHARSRMGAELRGVRVPSLVGGWLRAGRRVGANGAGERHHRVGSGGQRRWLCRNLVARSAGAPRREQH